MYKLGQTNPNTRRCLLPVFIMNILISVTRKTTIPAVQINVLSSVWIFVYLSVRSQAVFTFKSYNLNYHNNEHGFVTLALLELRAGRKKLHIHVKMREVKIELFIHMNVNDEVNKWLSWAGQTQYKQTQHKYRLGWLYGVVQLLLIFFFILFLLLTSWLMTG